MNLGDFTSCIQDNADFEQPITFYDIQAPLYEIHGKYGATVSVGKKGLKVVITIASDKSADPLYPADVIESIKEHAHGLEKRTVEVILRRAPGYERASVHDSLWGGITAHSGNRFALTNGGNSEEEALRNFSKPTESELRQQVKAVQARGFDPIPAKRDPLGGWKDFLDSVSGLKKVRR